MLEKLIDSILSELPEDEDKEFRLRFSNAINDGSDLSMVIPRFRHWILVDPEYGVIKFPKNKEVIQAVADLYARVIAGEEVDKEEWAIVHKAARDSHDYAAAYYAAAAYTATYKKVRLAQAEKLLQLISEAPIKERKPLMQFKYVKQPVVIEAVQFTISSGNTTPFPDWYFKALESGVIIHNGTYLTIKTLEGDHRGDLGDWIIQGVKGELYPCKPDIFEMTYSKYEDNK